MKYIICFLFFFGAACITPRTVPQKEINTSEPQIDTVGNRIRIEIPLTGCKDKLYISTPIDTPDIVCMHKWVLLEKDTVRSNIYEDACENNRLICVRCFREKDQVYIPFSDPKYRPSMNAFPYEFSITSNGIRVWDPTKGVVRATLSGDTVSWTFPGWSINSNVFDIDSENDPSPEKKKPSLKKRKTPMQHKKIK